jgi:hypothetical protein
MLKFATVGKQCSGKTTCIEYLQQKVLTYLKQNNVDFSNNKYIYNIKFADPLYSLQNYFSGKNLINIQNMLNKKIIDLNIKNYIYKNILKIDPESIPNEKAFALIQALYSFRDLNLDLSKKDRLFLQQTGEYIKKDMYEHIFVDIFKNTVIDLENSENPPLVLFCDDIRRDYEYQLASNLGFNVYAILANVQIRKDRADKNGIVFSPNHISELGVDDILVELPSNVFIENNATLDDFYDTIDSTVYSKVIEPKLLELINNIKEKKHISFEMTL